MKGKLPKFLSRRKNNAVDILEHILPKIFFDGKIHITKNVSF